MISPKSFSNRVLERNGQLGEDVAWIMAAALQAVDPYECVRKQLSYHGDYFKVEENQYSLLDIDRIIVIGFGKASVAMAKAVLDCFENKVTLARVITKSPQFLNDVGYQNLLQVDIAAHPVPDERSTFATSALISELPELTPRDLVFVVISGGGSALFTEPLGGITLADLQVMTGLLLRSGADISEINTLRKHVDGVKGGRLAARLTPANVHTLILSDVVGDRLDMIASGTTVPDPTSYRDAWRILKKYHLENKVPKTILSLIEDGLAGKIPETLKEDDFKVLRIFNHLVGTNQIAAQAAEKEAKRLGYHSQVITNTLTGLTQDVVEIMMSDLESESLEMTPFCLIYGGETTVNVTGDGLGGRNQDLVLRMVEKLKDIESVIFISLATDGEDGPTDAAGAASDAIVFHEGMELSLDPATYIITNNAYEYLAKVGALFKIGSTGTNVNDLILIIGSGLH